MDLASSTCDGWYTYSANLGVGVVGRVNSDGSFTGQKPITIKARK